MLSTPRHVYVRPRPPTRSLKTPVGEAMKYDGDRQTVFELGRLGSNAARIEGMKSRLQQRLMDKCSNPNCANPSSEKELSECAACRSARYCSRDCQLAHWNEHKATCKVPLSALPANTPPAHPDVSPS